ncbi:uncharacterized protein LOC110457195 [Mizuhopecten yessoensis]|uniref:uncharacterized protein LOC110457195 n=1 Tax=Mizuhopecten yessoensis TaxID=6573 RepID=UPI000B45BE42|nr:uncharacterized protein LOC110457195 [Mizuhopecten yessoensis]
MMMTSVADTETSYRQRGHASSKLGANPRALRDRSNRLLAKEIQTKHGLKILPERPGSKDPVSGVKPDLRSRSMLHISPTEATPDIKGNKSGDFGQKSNIIYGKAAFCLQQKRCDKKKDISYSNVADGKSLSSKHRIGVSKIRNDDHGSVAIDCRQRAIQTNQNTGKDLKGNKATYTVSIKSTDRREFNTTLTKKGRNRSIVSIHTAGSDNSSEKFIGTQRTQKNQKSITNVTLSTDAVSIRNGSNVLRKSVTSVGSALSKRQSSDATPHFSRRVFVSTKHVGVLKDGTQIQRGARRSTGDTAGSRVIKKDFTGSKMMATKKDNSDKDDINSLYKHRTKVKYKDKNTESVQGFDLKEATWRNANNSADNTLESLSDGTVEVSKSESNWKDIDSTTGTGLRRRRSLIPRVRSSTQRANGTGDCDRNDTNKQGLLQSSSAVRGAVLSVRAKVYTNGEGHAITGHMEIPGQSYSDHGEIDRYSLDSQNSLSIIARERRKSCPVFTEKGINSTCNIDGKKKGRYIKIVNKSTNHGATDKCSDSADSILHTLDSVVTNLSETGSPDIRKLRHSLSKIPTPTSVRQTSRTSTLSESLSDEVCKLEKFNYNKTDGNVAVNTNTGIAACTTDGAGTSKCAAEAATEQGADRYTR